MLAKLKPDILLLDVRTPEKDGLSVLEEVNFDSCRLESSFLLRRKMIAIC